MAVGWRNREETRVQLREPLESKGVQWLADGVEKIDAPNKQLTLRNGSQLQYDYLVIATGPKLAFEEVSGVGPSG